MKTKSTIYCLVHTDFREAKTDFFTVKQRGQNEPIRQTSVQISEYFFNITGTAEYFDKNSKQ